MNEDTDITVECTVCRRTTTADAVLSLRSGWPTCCGYTMRLISTRKFIAAVEGGAVKRAVEGRP